MTLASSNRASLAYIEESSFGVTPGSGTAKALRFTGESLSFDLSKETSGELRDDRQNSGATTVNAITGGSVNFELSYAEYDPIFANALMNPWAVHGTNGVGSTFTADVTSTTITNTGAALTGSNAFTTLARGQWFLFRGQWLRVSTATAPTSTVITLDASTPATTGTGLTNCTVSTSRLSNGVTQGFFSLEKKFADVSQFMLYRGQQVSKLNLSFGAGALTTGSFELMGKDMVRAGVTGLPSAPAASKTYKGVNGVTGIGALWEGGVPLDGVYFKSLDLSLDNGLRAQTALGTLGPVGLGVGDCKGTGSVMAYFSDGDLYDKYLNDTGTGLILGTRDAALNGYVLTMPNATLMTARVVAGGKNQDVMAELTYEVFADLENPIEALRKTLFIDRLGAAVA